ncbi:alpha/beta hydrolase [Mycolicibacter icosiumassiliensis]|uniref:alpha/beta hydrolase n=1 Tax=Mycolicibacter icosiumassiliensis TaxID=1792835 RepID=UPI00082DD70D|nr:alpha/beta hydrolase [Mycolicibacter icosiumassiliensis]
MSMYLPPPILRAAARALARTTFLPLAPWRFQRRMLDLTFAWPGAPRGLAVHATELVGVPAEMLSPEHPDARVLLYLHGGGYTVGSPRSHRALAGRLALALNAATYVPDYRLAPEHRFPAAFDDSFAAYQALLNGGWQGEQIFVAGDSAGGGLSLALGVAAVQRGLPTPASIGLLCPGIDMTPDARARLPRGRRDPVLTHRLLERFCDAYVDPEDRARPAVSPLLADLAGLPPLVVDAAGNDMLSGQARRLADKARQAGVAVHHREHSGMPHGFHSGAGLLTQADRALDDVAAALLALSANSRRRTG